jgi:hypothetical protein
MNICTMTGVPSCDTVTLVGTITLIGGVFEV